MLNAEIKKLLISYYKCKNKKGCKTELLLKDKYEEAFVELKYLFNRLFNLQNRHYEAEVNEIFNDIEQKEILIIAILEELIDISK